jgi:SET domain
MHETEVTRHCFMLRKINSYAKQLSYINIRKIDKVSNPDRLGRKKMYSLKKRADKKMRDAVILVPEYKNGKYLWPGLSIKTSTIEGMGVFTTQTIKSGTMIPILGYKRVKPPLNKSHVWIYNNGEIVDGHPSFNRDNANLALMINEDLSHKPNCFFKLDFVVVAKNLLPHTELTIDYGPQYDRSHYATTRSSREYIYPIFRFPSFQERLKYLKREKK